MSHFWFLHLKFTSKSTYRKRLGSNSMSTTTHILKHFGFLCIAFLSFKTYSIDVIVAVLHTKELSKNLSSTFCDTTSLCKECTYIWVLAWNAQMTVCWAKVCWGKIGGLVTEYRKKVERIYILKREKWNMNGSVNEKKTKKQSNTVCIWQHLSEERIVTELLFLRVGCFFLPSTSL